MGGQTAYRGDAAANKAWNLYQFDTTATDSSWQFRLNMSSDTSITRLGMYVDDVRVRRVVATAPTVTADPAETIEALWTDPFNWTPKGAPTATTDVIINGMFGSPVITPRLNASSSCLSLRIGETASSTLDLTGAFNLTISGQLTLETNGTISDPGDGGSILLGGSWTRNGTGTFTAGTTTVELNGSGSSDQVVFGAMTGGNAFNNLRVNRGAGAGVVSLQSNVAANGTLTIDAGTLNVVGADGLAHTAGALTMNAGGLTFGGANDASLTVSGATTLAGGTLTLDTSGANPDLLDCNGGLSLGGAFALTTSMTGGEIRVAGAWDDTTTTGVIDPSGGTIQLDPAPGVATVYGITTKTGASQTRFFNLGLAGNANATFNPNQGLVVDNDMTVSGGTFSFDDTLLPTTATLSHTVAGNFTQSGGTIATNRQTGVGSILTVTGNFTASGGSFDNTNSAGSEDGTSDRIRVGGNVSVTSATWEAGTDLGMDGATGPRTISMVSGAKVKVLRMMNTGQTTTANNTYVGAGELVLTSGTFTVSGTTTVDLSVAPVGGWPGGAPANAGFRFYGTSLPANRVLNVSGGTFTTGTSGRFNIDDASGGNGTLNLSGGTLTVGTGGFDFPDGADFALNLTGGTLQCSGNWTVQDSADADAPTWSMTTSTVEWNGTAAQAVAHGGGNLGAAPFYNLTQNGGARTVTPSTALQVNATWSINDGTFTTNGLNHEGRGNVTVGWDGDATPATLIITSGSTFTHNVAAASDVRVNGSAVGGRGTLQINGGGTLRLSDASTLRVLADGQPEAGRLLTSGTSASSRATLTRLASYAGAENWAMVLTGVADISYATFSYLDALGVQVGATAQLVGWTGIRFSNGTAGGLYLDLSAATSATTLPTTMNLCQFDAGPANNVRGAGGAATHTNVTFSNWSGALGGEGFETNDPLDLIDWGASGAVVRTATGDSYPTIQDAINAVAGPNETIEVRDNVIRTETLDLSTFPFDNLTIDGAILRVTGATSGIKGKGRDPALFSDERLVNLVLIRDPGATGALLEDCQRVYHCTIVGGRADGALIKVGAGKFTTLANCIVGDAANAGTWGTTDNILVSNSGTYSSTNSDYDRATITVAPYLGTGNINSNPQFVMFHPSSGVYDLHLRSGSPCIDAAPAPPGGLATDFDRGTDFGADANNARRPNDDPNKADAGGIYDIGADELGPLVESVSGLPQGVPVWVERAGNVDTDTANPAGDPDSFTNQSVSFNWSPYVIFMGENRTVGAIPDLVVVARRMDNGNIHASYDINEVATGIDKLISVTSKMTAGGGTEDVYLVVDTDNDGQGDALIALQYNPAGPSFAPHAGWPQTGGNPTPQAVGTSGAMGFIAIGPNDATDLFVVRGGNLFRRSRLTGAIPAATSSWNASGQKTGDHAGSYDAEGALFADLFNDILYVPINRDALHAPTHELAIVARSTGVEGATANLNGVVDVGKNHTGFALMNGRVWATPWQDNFVWALKQDTLASSPPPYWQSADIGRNVTTRAQTFRALDAHVRVGAGNRVYKLVKENGTLSTDSTAGGDWGNDRPFRGNLMTVPAIVGNSAKTIFDTGTPGGASRRGAKMIFGTDQGCCYVLSYIRAANAADDTKGDYQRANNGGTVNYDILDGRPYPGYPYRVPGVKVTRAFLATHSSGRNLIVFLFDNGWMYAFVEPY